MCRWCWPYRAASPLAPEKFFRKIKNQKIEKQKNRNRRGEKIKKAKIPESLEKRKRLQELRNGEARIVLDLPPLPAASYAQPNNAQPERISRISTVPPMKRQHPSG
jgi:hypothetical protein